MDNLHFLPNNILINFFEELTKYENDYIVIVFKLYIYIYIYIRIILRILIYFFKVYSCICMRLQASLYILLKLRENPVRF